MGTAPAWFRFPFAGSRYLQGEYEQLVDRTKRSNLLGLFWTPLAIATTRGELGRTVEAAAAAQGLRKASLEIPDHA